MNPNKAITLIMLNIVRVSMQHLVIITFRYIIDTIFIERRFCVFIHAVSWVLYEIQIYFNFVNYFYLSRSLLQDVC